MKDNGLHSPYARLGIALAYLFPILAMIFSLPKISEGSTAYQQVKIEERNLNYTHQWSDEIDRQFTDNRFMEDYMREEVPENPCYEVSVDESLLVGMERYRSDLVGEELLDIENLLTEDFKTALARDFSTRIWDNSKNCFEGSFIVSFAVTEDGKLGPDMLVHHLKGQSNEGGKAAVKVLFDLQATGHRWHDGSQPAGEVRLPVRFKLL